MELLIFVYLLWIIMGVVGALMLLNKNSLPLFFWGIVVTLYGSIPGIGMIIDSRFFKNPMMEFFGQSLLVFFSVIGGAIISSAWMDLRAKWRKKDKGQS